MINEKLLAHLTAGKRALDFGGPASNWDLLISAFNSSARVREPFATMHAARKCWLLHAEYGYTPEELPSDAEILRSGGTTESDFIIEALGSVLDPALHPRLAVDITGFMRPHLLFLVVYLKSRGYKRFDALYTEPSHYKRKAETIFSSSVTEVRQVAGYEGVHGSDVSNDVLLVGVGYDHELISSVISHKSGARLVQLLSLPSLSADMYQESLLRFDRVSDAPPAHVPDEQVCFASANDPFVTAASIAEAVQRLNERNRITNLYLSPLATKPQTLGFALYYVREAAGGACSVVFPFSKSYSKETSMGRGRSWLYSVDLS
jgi:hypothetical protein